MMTEKDCSELEGRGSKFLCQWNGAECVPQEKLYCFGKRVSTEGKCMAGCSRSGDLCIDPEEVEEKEKLCPLQGKTVGGELQCAAAGCFKGMLPMIDKLGAFIPAAQGREGCVADSVLPISEPLKKVLRFRLKGPGGFVLDGKNRGSTQDAIITGLRNANLVSPLVNLEARVLPDGDAAKVHLLASANLAEYLVSIDNKFDQLRSEKRLVFPEVKDLAGVDVEVEDSRSMDREFTLDAFERIKQMRNAAGAGVDSFRRPQISAAERLDDSQQCSDILAPLTTACGLPSFESGMPTLQAAVSGWLCSLEDSTCCETLEGILEDNQEVLHDTCSSTTVETLRLASSLICSSFDGMSICKGMEQIRPLLADARSAAAAPTRTRLRKACEVAPAVRDHFESAVQELEALGIMTGVSEAMDDELRQIDAMCSMAPSETSPTNEDFCAPSPDVWSKLGGLFTRVKPVKDLLGLVQTSTCDQKIAQALTKKADDVRDLGMQCMKPEGSTIKCDAKFAAETVLSLASGAPNFADILSPKKAGLECWPARLAYGVTECPQTCKTAMESLSRLGCCAAQVKKDWLNAGVATGLEVAVGVVKKCGVDIPDECKAENPQAGTFEPFSMLMEVPADVINGLGGEVMRRAVQKDIAEEMGLCDTAIPFDKIDVTAIDDRHAVFQGQIFDPRSVLTEREAHALGHGKSWGSSGRLMNKIGKGMRFKSVKKAIGGCGRKANVIATPRNKVPKKHRAWIVLRRKKKVKLSGCDLALKALRLAAGSAAMRVKFMNALSSFSPFLSSLVDSLLDKFCATVDTDAIVDRLTDCFSKCGPAHTAEISAIQSAFSFCETETGTAPPTSAPSIAPPPTRSPFPIGAILSRRPVTLHTKGNFKLRLFMHKKRKAVWNAIKSANLKGTLDDLCDTSNRWIRKTAKKVIRRSQALLDAAGLKVGGCSTSAIVEEVIDKIGCQKHQGVYLLVDEHVRRILKNLRKLKTLDVTEICANPKLRRFRRFLRQAGGILGRHRFFPKRMRWYLRTLCQTKDPPTPSPAVPAPPVTAAPVAAPTPPPFDPTDILLDRKADAQGISDCFDLSSKASRELSEACHPMNLGLDEIGDCLWDGNCALDGAMLTECKDELKQYAETLGCCLMSELQEAQRGLRGGPRAQMKRRFVDALTHSGRGDILRCPTEAPRSANFLKVTIRLTMAAAKMEYQDVAAALHDDMLDAYGVAATAVRNIQIFKNGALWGQGLERHAEAQQQLDGNEEVTYMAELACADDDECNTAREHVREEGCEGENIAALLADSGELYSEDDVECPVAEHVKVTDAPAPTPEDSDNSSMNPVAIAFLCSFILGGGLLGFVVYKNRVNASRHAAPVATELDEADDTTREAAPYSEPREERGSDTSGSPRRNTSALEEFAV